MSVESAADIRIAHRPDEDAAKRQQFFKAAVGIFGKQRRGAFDVAAVKRHHVLFFAADDKIFQQGKDFRRGKEIQNMADFDDAAVVVEAGRIQPPVDLSAQRFVF